MAQMRSAMRALVAVDPRPAAVVGGLDRVFETLHVDQLVTMVYALADPSPTRWRSSTPATPSRCWSAADGTVEALSQHSTLILGVGGGDRSVLRWSSVPATRCCSTPTGWSSAARGLRRRDRPAGRRAVAGLADDLGEWLTRVVETTRDPTRDDDVAALLVVRDG